MVKKILLVNCSAGAAKHIDKYLTKKGHVTASVKSGKQCLKWLRQNKADIVLSSNSLDDGPGIELLPKIKAMKPRTRVLLLAEKGTVREAVLACKNGADDYLSPPFVPGEISRKIDKPNLPNAGGNNASQFVRGLSESSQRVVKEIDLVAATNMSVVITGETGTGKEFVAREIHRKSNRRNKKFVAVDCGAISSELAASELFGHLKGAFTGATSDKRGFFEMADNGTLFLDEIANLNHENQIKLLRVLQEGRFRRLGSEDDVSVDVRVLAASKDNLEECVRLGTFRDDLFYRLNEFEIIIEPLRNKPADIELYAHHFLAMANQQLNKSVRGFSKTAMRKLLDYHWPGNLRELKNTVKRMVLRCYSGEIDLETVPRKILRNDTLNGAQTLNIDRFGERSLESIVGEVEKLAITDVLRKVDDNKARAARLLSIDRKTLYKKLDEYQISNKQA